MFDITYKTIIGFSSQTVLQILLFLSCIIIMYQCYYLRQKIYKYKTFLLILFCTTILGFIFRYYLVENEFILSTHHGISHVFRAMQPHLDNYDEDYYKLYYPQSFMSILSMLYYIFPIKYTSAFLLNSLIGALSTMVVGIFVMLYFESQSAAIWTGLLLSFFPFHIRYSSSACLTISLIFWAFLSFIQIYFIYNKIKYSGLGLFVCTVMTINSRWEGLTVIAINIWFSLMFWSQDNHTNSWLKTLSILALCPLFLQESIAHKYVEISRGMRWETGGFYSIVLLLFLCSIAVLLITRYNFRFSVYLRWCIIICALVLIKNFPPLDSRQLISGFDLVVTLPFLIGAMLLIFEEKHHLLAVFLASLALSIYAIHGFRTGVLPFGSARTELFPMALAFSIAGYGIAKSLYLLKMKNNIIYTLTSIIAGAALFTGWIMSNENIIWDQNYSPQKEYELILDAPFIKDKHYIITTCSDCGSQNGYFKRLIFKPRLALYLLKMRHVDYEYIECKEIESYVKNNMKPNIIFYYGVDCYRTKNNDKRIVDLAFLEKNYEIVPIIEKDIKHRQFVADKLPEFLIKEQILRIGFYEILGLKPEI